MAALLHVLTKADDPLPATIIAEQKTNPEHHVEVVDLTIEEPDYKALLEKIFAADNVQVW